MLNSSNNVIFYAGALLKSITVNSIIYTAERIGSIEEDLNYKLIEDYQAYRISIKIKMALNQTDADWFFNTFIPSTAKKLRIDYMNSSIPGSGDEGFDEIDVVMIDKKISAELINGSNKRGYITINFAKITPGDLDNRTP